MVHLQLRLRGAEMDTSTAPLPTSPPLAQGCRTSLPAFSYFCLPRNVITILKALVPLIWDLNPCVPCRYLMKKSSLNKLCS